MIFEGSRRLRGHAELRQRRGLRQRRQQDRRSSTGGDDQITSTTSSRPSAAASSPTSTPTSRRPPLQRPVPPGQHLVSAGQEGAGKRRSQTALDGQDHRQRADTLERTLAHLKDNGVDLAATKMQVGPTARLRPHDGNVHRQRRSQRDAHPRVSQAVRGARGGPGLAIVDFRSAKDRKEAFFRGAKDDFENLAWIPATFRYSTKRGRAWS